MEPYQLQLGNLPSHAIVRQIYHGELKVLYVV